LKTIGLSLDQAPPLSIPASFFLTIPVGILVAAYLMLTTVTAVSLGSPWTPLSIALTHVGTLGVLAMGMIGALYQMIPVVAGTPVPLARLAHVVHLLLMVGLGGFLWRLMGGPIYAMTVTIACFTIAFITFLLPLGWSLLRSTTQNDTVRGMRLAILSLATVTVVGLVMARGFAGGTFPPNPMLWVQIHLMLALLGWVGGLIMAVSWPVIPMFYLATTISLSARRWLFGLLLTGLVLPVLTVFAPGVVSLSMPPGQLAAIAALPAAVVIWLGHPALILHSILRRKRKRSDASLLFWKTGLVIALLLIPIAITALLLPDPRWQVLFGWLTIWGWAGLIMHGMLSRIVPFLVWFHRYSARVGLEPVPSMRSLLSQRRIQVGFGLHLASVLLGAATILVQADILAQLTGLLLIATAASLGSMQVHVLRHRPARKI
jgi:hypothetical protein